MKFPAAVALSVIPVWLVMLVAGRAPWPVWLISAPFMVAFVVVAVQLWKSPP